MKNKKTLTIAIICLLMGGVIYNASSYLYRSEMSLKRLGLQYSLPKGFDSASVSELYKMGFKNVQSAGFINAVIKRKMYNEKYGLLFMSDSEVESFLKDNNFIMGDADKYIGNLPEHAVTNIISNFEKLNDKRSVYLLTLTHDRISFELYSDELKYEIVDKATVISWDTDYAKTMGRIQSIVKESAMANKNIPNSDFWTLRKMKNSNERVMVIGGAKDFNTTGMELVKGIISLPVPKDPIAILKVPGGYVELASWE